MSLLVSQDVGNVITCLLGCLQTPFRGESILWNPLMLPFCPWTSGSERYLAWSLICTACIVVGVMLVDRRDSSSGS